MNTPPVAFDAELPLPLSDLLARAAQGDVGAFARLYDDTAPRVYGLVLRVVRDPALAEEVTRTIFVQAWHQAGSFDIAHSSALAWLMASAHRHAVDSVRGAQTNPVSPAVVAPGAGPHPVPSDGDVVLAALSRLAPEQRESLELAYFGGYTHTEVDLLVDSPHHTAPRLIREALVQLRLLLPPAA